MGGLGLWTRGKFSSNGKIGFLNKACMDSDLFTVAPAFYRIKIAQSNAVVCTRDTD